jgi:hypothetical protein
MSQESRNLKEQFLVELSALLAVDGFKRKGRREFFTQNVDGLVKVFQVICLDGKPGWRIQPNIGLRFDRVESIFHQTSGFEPKYQKDTCTVGAPAGVIMGGTARTCEFIIESDADLAPASKNVMQIFREIAIPYYTRWSILQEIDAALNNNPSERASYLRGGGAWFRCSTGLIVAKLVKRQNYDQLVALYSDAMAKDNSGFYLKHFQALVESLDSVA